MERRENGDNGKMERRENGEEGNMEIMGILRGGEYGEKDIMEMRGIWI